MRAAMRLLSICWLSIFTFQVIAAKTFPPPSWKARQAQLLKALNEIESLEADFEESSENGMPQAKRTGKLYLRRFPGTSKLGKLAIDYPRADGRGLSLKILSQDQILHMHDFVHKSHETIALDVTPLRLVLRPHIRLGNFLKAHRPEMRGGGGEPQTLAWKLFDPQNPDAFVVLFFNPNTLAFKGWEVCDLQGRYTRIVLRNVKTNAALPPASFASPPLQ